MKYGVYANSSAAIGEGHCIRCLNLVHEITIEKIVWFYTSLTERVKKQLDAQENIELMYLSSGNYLADEIMRQSVDVIIIDDYQLTLAEPLSKESLILVFDDLANRPIYADILIDANPLRIKEDYKDRVNASCELLLNESYMMLKPEYFSDLTDKKERTGHIFFGATDPLKYSYQVASYLCRQYPDWQWYLVVTSLTANVNDCLRLADCYDNITVEFEPDSLAAGLIASKVAIGAPGTTTWERLAARCNSGLIASNNNQIDILKALHEKNYLSFLAGNSIEEHLQAIDLFIEQASSFEGTLNFSKNAAKAILEKLIVSANKKFPERYYG